MLKSIFNSLAAAVIAISPLGTLLEPGTTADCPADVRWSTGCPEVEATINGPDVVIEGTVERPGTTPSAPPMQLGPVVDPAPSPVEALTPNGQRFWDEFVIIEPITLADLASFRPDTGTTHMQPNGWTIAGLPTNFWIDTQPHTLSGLLLDLPATVQFTPVAARFSYGDNTPTVRTPLGSSWTNAGVVEFSPTSTSHTYRTTGTYTITPRVDFTVQYSYDGSEWIPIDGILTATADPLTATVVRASTVLVAGDCTQLPNGPGC